MSGLGKSFALILIVILAVSILIVAKPAFAQTPTSSTIPTPSVPQFTIHLVGPSYTVPTTYSLDPNTGQIVAQIGYVVEYPNVVVTIKNQPFTSYVDSSRNTVYLYYNIQLLDDQTSAWQPVYNTASYPVQSTDSDYTNISIQVTINPVDQGITIPVGTQTHIQVEALIGYITSTYEAYNPNPPYFGGTTYSFVGQTSSWSPTQTVTIPANVLLSSTSAPSSSTQILTPTPTPSSSTSTLSPTPTLTSFSSASYASLLLIALVVIAFLLAVIIFLLLYMRHRKNL